MAGCAGSDADTDSTVTDNIPQTPQQDSPPQQPVAQPVLADAEVEFDEGLVVEESAAVNTTLGIGDADDMNIAHRERRCTTANYAGASGATQDVLISGFVHCPPVATDWNTEGYAAIDENKFKLVGVEPLSTFSVDVDRASYANVRRFLNDDRLPPPDAVRIEEMINYFRYDYPQPTGDDPLAIVTEVSDCPWNPGHRLVHIGLQARSIDLTTAPPSNLVFLLDVSGSMNNSNKLPLVKQSMRLLVDQLRPQDRVAIVVYAGAAGLVLPSTSGSEKQDILDAIDRLNAGGSTAGGAGIRLAYDTAAENYQHGGNNRVILCTDGDFNVGESSDGAMERLIEERRGEGVFLTVLGFGMGNYQDSKLETLADQGNGNYGYIDDILEAKKMLVNEMGGTMYTIAKDVKVQVEFNPAHVKAYRLVGYENRLLAAQDFNDDTKDAGEMGSGHTVTALYELITADSDEAVPGVDELRYQDISPRDDAGDEMLTVKFRYKDPDGDTSKLIVRHLEDRRVPLARASDNFRFSAAVAAFGMLLRDSEYTGDIGFDDVRQMARNARGDDPEGYRGEFLRLVEKAELLDGQAGGGDGGPAPRIQGER
ncbi:MAG: VWA domain-containing protein [Candidatus Cloacimonetes bacterium]|nr:VWA domain-containing protein [Candidatus Cloacimonadota bacterium]